MPPSRSEVSRGGRRPLSNIDENPASYDQDYGASFCSDNSSDGEISHESKPASLTDTDSPGEHTSNGEDSDNEEAFDSTLKHPPTSIALGETEEESDAESSEGGAQVLLKDALSMLMAAIPNDEELAVRIYEMISPMVQQTFLQRSYGGNLDDISALLNQQRSVGTQKDFKHYLRPTKASMMKQSSKVDLPPGHPPKPGSTQPLTPKERLPSSTSPSRPVSRQGSWLGPLSRQVSRARSEAPDTLKRSHSITGRVETRIEKSPYVGRRYTSLASGTSSQDNGRPNSANSLMRKRNSVLPAIKTSEDVAGLTSRVQADTATLEDEFRPQPQPVERCETRIRELTKDIERLKNSEQEAWNMYELKVKQIQREHEDVLRAKEAELIELRGLIRSLQDELVREKEAKNFAEGELAEMKRPMRGTDEPAAMNEDQKMITGQAQRIRDLEQHLVQARASESAVRKEMQEANARAELRTTELEEQLRQSNDSENTLETSLSSVEEARQKLQHDLDITKPAKERLEKEEGELIDHVKWLEQQCAEAQALVDAEKALRETAEEKIKCLERDTKDYQIAISDVEKGVPNSEATNEASDSYAGSIQQLQADIDTIRQTMRGNTRDIEAYRDILDTSDEGESKRIVMIRVSIRKLLDQYMEMLSNVKGLIAPYHKEMQESEKQLRQAEKEREEELEMTDEQHLKWKPLYENEKMRHKRLKATCERLKTKVKELYQTVPELRHENKELRSRLSDCRDHGNLMKEQAQKWQEQALHWETEYTAKEAICEKHRSHLESQLEMQKEEMLKYIKDYHDCMPENDPDWWAMEGLQRKIKDVERQLTDVKDMLARVKGDRETAYRKIETLMDEKKALAEETERLRLGILEEMEAPEGDSGYDSNWKPRKNDKKDTWSQSKEEAAKQRKTMEEFKEKQRIDREEGDTARAQQVMEKVRMWKMGLYYPPRRVDWGETVEKTPWERWEGERWLREAATLEETREAEKVKNAIVL